MLQFSESILPQRGLIQRSLEEGRLPPEPFVQYARLVATQAAFTKLFNDYALPEVMAKYRAFSDVNGKAPLRHRGAER